MTVMLLITLKEVVVACGGPRDSRSSEQKAIRRRLRTVFASHMRHSRWEWSPDDAALTAVYTIVKEELNRAK